jgi:hypothetical protein
MKIIRILALEEVRFDLNDGEAFYEMQSPGLGSYFRDSLIADLQSLWLYAGIHSKQYGFYRMRASRFAYAIYYHIQDSGVIIVAILDMRQNPSKTRS